VSPMPESRRAMIDRGRLFDVPTYRWIPAKTRVESALRRHPRSRRGARPRRLIAGARGLG
jgi:hypothetical protein